MNGLQIDLLQLWNRVYQEAVQLSDAIEGLPDACECGDADAHLEGRCRCCNGHERAEGRKGENCAAVLARLQADLAMLSKDFTLIAAPVEAGGFVGKHMELRRGVFLAANDLQQILEAFERISKSAVGFRRTCSIADMLRIKRCCIELREHCERVNSELMGR